MTVSWAAALTALIGVAVWWVSDANIQASVAVTPDPPSIASLINGGIDALYRRLGPTLGALAAIGVLTMAVQEAVKRLTRYHRVFNRDTLRRWGARHPEALEQLVFAAAGTRKAECWDAPFLDLDAAGVAAQLSRAARLALAFPREHSHVLQLLTGELGDTHVATLVAALDREQVRTSAAPPKVATTQEELAAADELQRARERDLAEAEAARVRLTFLIDRALDALQVSLAFEWERLNRRVAFALSVVLTVVLSLLYYWNAGVLERASGDISMHYLTILSGGLLSGFLAPVAKDLLTALESVRPRR